MSSRGRYSPAPRWLAVLVSAGAMTAYSWVRSDTTWLGWIALAPWLAVVDAAPSARAALAWGLAMCVAFTAGLFWWLGLAIEAYAGLPGGSWIVLTLVGAPFLQPQFVVAAGARFYANRGGAGAVARAIVTAGAYVGAEWLLPKLLGDTIGHGLLPVRTMRQAADLVGAPGLTVALLLANDGTLACWRAGRAGNARGALRAAAGVLALAAALSVYGATRLAQLAAAGAGAPTLTVGVVQGGFANYADLRAAHGTFEATRRILNAYLGSSVEAVDRGAVDLLVWPETVYPTTFGAPKSPDGAAFDRALATFVTRTGVPLVFGGYDAGPDGREYNAAILLEPPAADGGDVTFDAYRKTWLFPLTERVPAWLDQPAVRRRLPWLGTWTGGDGPAVLRMSPKGGPPVGLVPLVCYDAVVPAHARAAVAQGGQLLVTLSNDAWFGRGPGTWLHLAVSAFRSIETRRPQVRATTTGISAVIDATGEIVEAASPGERRVLVAAVRPSSAPPTPIMRTGDWPSPASLALASVLLAAITARGGRRPRPRRNRPAARRRPD